MKKKTCKFTRALKVGHQFRLCTWKRCDMAEDVARAKGAISK